MKSRCTGADRLERVTIRNRADGSLDDVDVHAVFIFIGADAITDWLPREVVRDERGYICTGRDVTDLMPDAWPLERDPYLLETSVPGIFAAGDVRHGSIKRVASGVGEGSIAIAFVHQHLASLVTTETSREISLRANQGVRWRAGRAGAPGRLPRIYITGRALSRCQALISSWRQGQPLGRCRSGCGG